MQKLFDDCKNNLFNAIKLYMNGKKKLYKKIKSNDFEWRKC